ncbi:MAG: UDP-N-acetylmuramoyl-L-alanyl-D-glutamate--2,6-diaminopimelate ligase [Bacteroidales bacterium]|nr:UDP-N-acetylmuramoyl-L-alanyl-D-glutamate--2,6-diaminopimelate ligase [Bacteroidales bacterium]MCR5245610.1 UDP-N-acetylmuramoyl-L-alanyl-D-glutamate--2,6-diaminopimelate ligase [Bacteroidales bacterium]
MRLDEIIKGTGAAVLHGSGSTQISAITSDSRKVTPGSLFIAVKGFSTDGHAYIQSALDNGAAAVVDADRRALALCADAFYGHPSGKLQLVGITGTNGKTTTVTLLYMLFRSLGYECGLLSTIANYVGSRRSETANTTADPITINSLMAEMVEAGCQYCFMEVSSIGIEQERTAGLEFKAGIFSNLTHDHLDYHKTFAEYLRCKKLFFDNLPAEAYAITNADDRNGDVMVQNTRAKKVTYSCRTAADHTCKVLEESFEGMLLRIDGTETWTRLIGRHNAYNLLAIYTTALVLGTPKDEVLLALSKLESAPGRLEVLHGPRDLAVVIDYAHTPDALENVLGTLRDVAPERTLVCLFGCGGDRDRSKRPEMAAIAEKLSDKVIVTSDNPRTEDPEAIIAEIMAGFTSLRKVVKITGREEAIKAAIQFSPDSSTILLAGKGHETYQITGTQKKHFDEREIVNETFKTLD